MGPEVCDAANVDEDCDGNADDDDPEGADGKTTFYADGDQDGHGAGPGVLRCDGGPGFASTDDDCDDANDGRFPGNPETVDDGVDQDCDDLELCFTDADDDGYRFGSSTLTSSDLDCIDPFEGRASDPPGDCDDGNPAVYPGAPELCSDGTDNDCDATADCSDPQCNADAACQSSCTGGPFVCKSAGRTKLALRKRSDEKRDTLSFSWTVGEATSVAELGAPDATTDYTVCVWDHVAGTPSLVMTMKAPAGGNCTGRPCWTPLSGGTAYRYSDAGRLPHGIQQLRVRSGALGAPRVTVKAKGVALPNPPMPFKQSPRITVQVVNDAGTCWGSDFVSPPQSNTDVRLIVKEKP